MLNFLNYSTMLLFVFLCKQAEEDEASDDDVPESLIDPATCFDARFFDWDEP